jgi:hypothetical protein
VAPRTSDTSILEAKEEIPITWCTTRNETIPLAAAKIRSIPNNGIRALVIDR